MDATELYQPILGLTEPWYVDTVTLDEPMTTVTIQLAHQRGSDLFRCPRCQQNAPVYDHLPERRWRHLDTCQYTTLAWIPTVKVWLTFWHLKTSGIPMFIDYRPKIRLASFRQIHQYPTLLSEISIFQAKFGISEFAIFLRKFDEISSILFPSIPVTFTVI